MFHDGRLRFTPTGELRQYFVYIVSNSSMTLYTGVTSDLKSRIVEHKQKSLPGFTARYHFDRLVYFESYENPADAIEREKQVKGWNRRRKIELIKSKNPAWSDLSSDL
ncbi:MAG TPA: GIY-YIG nuclease family protein [Thermoanaerobaculia bacterium]|nr:GIY-YIG nuclease family protein [Thermoanaerobaculia bacterium]